jgi:hypothetical protein
VHEEKGTKKKMGHHTAKKERERSKKIARQIR